MVLNVYLWNSTTPLRDVHGRGPKEKVTDTASVGEAPPVGSLLIGVKLSEDRDWDDESDRWDIVALGIVRSKRPLVTNRHVLTITPLMMLDPEPFERTLDQMEPAAAGRARRAGKPSDGHPIKLSETAARGILQILSKQAGVAEWLSWATAEQRRPARGARAELILETRDALTTAMQFADQRERYAPDVILPPQRENEAADPLEAIVSPAFQDSEEDLLPVELRRFRKKTNVEELSGSIVKLTGRDHNLWAFNVNKKPLEVALGVDLLYWDRDRDRFTMLQYKRLDEFDDTTRGRKYWRYTRVNEIRNQLKLMQEYVPTDAEAKDPDNWRMASPYWFKFVQRDAALRQDRKLLKGMYVPAGYLRLAVEGLHLKTGPNDGEEVTYDNVVSTGSTVFTRLVSKGLIGSVGEQSSDLVSLMDPKVNPDRNMIVVMKESWGEYRPEATGLAGETGSLNAFQPLKRRRR